MKKKPFDIDKMHDEKSDNNIDKEADQAIENALKSAFAEEMKNLHLTEEFKSSLITQMKQVANKENINNTVNNVVAIEKSINRTATEGAHTEGKKPSSNGVIHSIRHFLNREIEISLVPVLAASLLLIVINVMPLNYEPRPEGRIIEVGGSQLWIPYNGEGEDVAYEN